MALERYGSMNLRELLEPAILYAQEGFPVSELIAGQWQASTGLLAGHPDSRRVWLPGGHQAECRRCGQTVCVGDNELMYSFLGERCSGQE